MGYAVDEVRVEDELEGQDILIVGSIGCLCLFKRSTRTSSISFPGTRGIVPAEQFANS